MCGIVLCREITFDGVDLPHYGGEDQEQSDHSDEEVCELMKHVVQWVKEFLRICSISFA
jgi:hypothetical protein